MRVLFLFVFLETVFDVTAVVEHRMIKRIRLNRMQFIIFNKYTTWSVASNECEARLIGLKLFEYYSRIVVFEHNISGKIGCVSLTCLDKGI